MLMHVHVPIIVDLNGAWTEMMYHHLYIIQTHLEEHIKKLIIFFRKEERLMFSPSANGAIQKMQLLFNKGIHS